MKIIITRPAEDSKALAEGLAALGHEPVLAPLLFIRFADEGAIPDRPYQAVLFTSANGVRALARHHEGAMLARLPAFTVGPVSARAASEAGFGPVSIAGGDVAALEKLVRARLDPRNGPVLHVSGEQTAGDLACGLARFEVERAVLYRAEPAPNLPEAAAAALGASSGVVLYSPRTARIWVELVERAGLAERAMQAIHYCLSRNVEKALSAGFGDRTATVVAQSPDDQSMLAAIGPA